MREWTPRIVQAGGDDGTGRSTVLAGLTALARARSVAVIAAPISAAAAPSELAAVIDGHLVVVLSDDDDRRAVTRARELAGARHGAGIAFAPFDGVDASALVESACAACDRAGAGEVVRAEEVVEQVALGKHVAVFADAATAHAYALARRLAAAEIPVTIGGPTGSGKELVAEAVHRFSPRANQPFVAVNCAAIPDSLADAELFGHAKGAFTGAFAARPGVIEASSGGTLFLDEVAELSLTTQARLLRVLEAGEVQRIGETTPRRIDLRVIAATHRDLAKEVAAHRFREDLRYRLGVARVELVPLRERPRDLAALVRHFVSRACARSGTATPRLAPATARALFAHSWPGNVRELRHVVEFAIAAAGDDPCVRPEHLPELRDEPRRCEARLVGGRSIMAEVQALERERMVEALAACDGVRNKAAALIDMPLRSFVTKLKRYGITERDWSRRFGAPPPRA